MSLDSSKPVESTNRIRSGPSRVSRVLVFIALAGCLAEARIQANAAHFETPVFEPASVGSEWLDENDFLTSNSFSGRQFDAYLWLGGDYFNADGDTFFGGHYGLDTALYLDEEWVLLTTVSGNQLSDGIQIVGSVGASKLPKLDEGVWWQPMTAAVLFDQFTDTRFDSFYLTQLRVQIGYAFNERFSAGINFVEPLNDEKNVRFIDPRTGVTAFGTFQQSQTFGAYFVGKLDEIEINGSAALQENPDTAVFSGGVRIPLYVDVTLYGGAAYAPEPGFWQTSLGIEFWLGPWLNGR